MGRELPTNLMRRGARIWVRIEVPKDVRAAYGKAMVFESTGHDDDKKGRAAGLKRLGELQAEWATLRLRLEMTPADRQRAALDLYARELAEDERNRLALPTAEQLAAIRAADSLPPRAPASAITKKAVVAWFDDLARYPKQAGNMTTFRGMTFSQVLDHNAKLAEPKPPISRRTSNKYLASLGGFCAWLISRGVLDTNPTAGLGFSDEETTPRRPYTLPELRSIFASPVYMGF